MALTLHEALELKALERFKLVAGINGLNNKISRAGIIDHETTEQIRQTLIPEEFIFGNMILIKDQPEQMLEYIKAIHESNASCFALKTIFFEEFPDEVIDYANKNKFPLFTFDETFIEDIILDIDQALNINLKLSKLQGFIDDMIVSESDPLKVRTLALKLNKSFSNHFIVARVTTNESQWSSQLLVSTFSQILGKKTFVIKHEDAILLICSFSPRSYSDETQDYMKEYIINALDACGLNLDQCIVGLSNSKYTLGDMGRALLESTYAYEYSELKKKNCSSFNALGIYQLLIPNLNNPWFYTYYESMIQPLIAYDEKNDSDLLYTAQTYVACDTNIQCTAEKLFQHVNTVRYRVKKIKEVLNIDALDGMKYESLALAIHLYELHNR